MLEQYTVISLWGKLELLQRNLFQYHVRVSCDHIIRKDGKVLKEKLNIDCLQKTFWSDNKVVLGYIRNTTKTFKIFVANRIQQIHENSEVNQWRYVPSKDNPADHASRGLIEANSGGKSQLG